MLTHKIGISVEKYMTNAQFLDDINSSGAISNFRFFQILFWLSIFFFFDLLFAVVLVVFNDWASLAKLAQDCLQIPWPCSYDVRAAPLAAGLAIVVVTDQ